MWEAAGGRVSYAVDGCSAVGILGDDPAATGAVALGVARAHALSRRVFLFDLLGDGQGVALNGGSDQPGVSDMVQFGVSLGHAACARPDSPNLFVVPGGAESPLSDEILTHRWWGIITGQVRRAEALLLVVAPALVPAMPAMVRHLDGVVLVGEAHAPSDDTRVIGEVRSAATMRTPATTVRSVADPAPAGRPRTRWRVAALAAIAVLAIAMLTESRWRPALQALLAGNPARASDTVLPPIPPPVSRPAIASNAGYSVELLFTNSDQDALQFLSTGGDSLPAATFATVSSSADSDRWYRMVAGAFPDSASAEAFLQQLRRRGLLDTGAGAIAHTPFALLLDSSTSDAVAEVRAAAYRGRGIPAYLLRDSALVWRVYAGAFPSESDGLQLQRQLDSLNIQSVLVLRAGSIP